MKEQTSKEIEVKDSGTTYKTSEVVKDSGKTQEFETGAHRDAPQGKGRCDLLPHRQVGIVMNADEVLLSIEKFMETREVLHLAIAIQESVNTVPRFAFSSIKKELESEGIILDEKTTNEQLLQSCLAHLMLEASKLYEAGAEKYGANNWKLGMPVNRYIDSGVRHYLKTLRGDMDEPHYRGFVWNLLCAMWTAENKPELNFKEEPEKR